MDSFNGNEKRKVQCLKTTAVESGEHYGAGAGARNKNLSFAGIKVAQIVKAHQHPLHGLHRAEQISLKLN